MFIDGECFCADGESEERIISSCGISMNEAIEAMERLMAAVPPFSELDIILIRNNPSLSWLQKQKLIAKIRKQMQKNRGDGY